jgi:hypothetical protein
VLESVALVGGRKTQWISTSKKAEAKGSRGARRGVLDLGDLEGWAAWDGDWDESLVRVSSIHVIRTFAAAVVCSKCSSKPGKGMVMEKGYEEYCSHRYFEKSEAAGYID